MYYQLPRLKYEPLPRPDLAMCFLRDYSLRVILPDRMIALLPEDPFIEEIRLRVRWGWEDALARLTITPASVTL